MFSLSQGLKTAIMPNYILAVFYTSTKNSSIHPLQFPNQIALALNQYNAVLETYTVISPEKFATQLLFNERSNCLA